MKKPNWQEATSWLFTKSGRVESGTTKSKSKPEVRVGSELGAATFKHNALHHWTPLPLKTTDY